MTGVKICGLNDPASFDAAVECGADWVGFVFFPPSPRYLLADQARALSARVVGGPGRVGLFVDPEDQHVAHVLARVKLDALQIYAPPARVAAIGARFAVPVWRGLGVGAAADLPTEREAVDGYMIDAKPPADATRPGGNARTFDWTVLRGWHAQLPWLLGGGLDAGNVAEAIRVSGAPAVDVSSGVERAPGVKDPKLIAAFLGAVKQLSPR